MIRWSSTIGMCFPGRCMPSLREFSSSPTWGIWSFTTPRHAARRPAVGRERGLERLDLRTWHESMRSEHALPRSVALAPDFRLPGGELEKGNRRAKGGHGAGPDTSGCRHDGASRLPALRNEREKLRVITDVIIGAVEIARQHEQHRVGCEAMLRAPHQRPDVQAECGSVEHDLVAIDAVVELDGACTAEANEKFVKCPVAMAATNLPRRNIADRPEAVGLERKMRPGRPPHEGAAQLGDRR